MKKNNSTIGQTLRLALLASTVVSGSMAWTAPALAQDDDEEEASQQSQAIVITGSRIRRPEYDSNSPMVTVDEEFLQQSTTQAVEQQLNKLPQFVVSQSSTVKNTDGVLTNAGGDIQPTATNTPGASTVSLRGIGSNRTLVLVDGRRSTPGNASGTTDVSTIPSAALERVEIISGGASATYGADAIAGVTNFILKKNFQGLELTGNVGMSQYGDGLEYALSGIMGTDFADGRGNVSIAMSMNTREEAYQRDRPWYRDLWYNNPTTTSGGGFFVGRPGVTLQALPANQDPAANPPQTTWCEATPQGCVLTNMFPGATPPVPNNTTAIYFNENGSIFTTGFAARGGSSAMIPWNDAERWKTTSVGTLTYLNTTNYLVTPSTRYNFLARGNYELNDWIGMFGSAMFSQNTTATTQEPGPITGGWGVSVPWGTGTYVGNGFTPSSVIRNGESYDHDGLGFTPNIVYVDSTPGSLADNPTNAAFRAIYGGATPILACANNATGGCTNTQAFQNVIPTALQTLLAARTDPNANITLQGLLPNNRETFSDVQTYNMVAGFEGSIPGTDWTWEAFVNHGVSTTLSRQTGIYALERLRGVYTSPNFGQNFRYTGNPSGSGFGAATATCTTGVDFFNVQGNYDNISQDCKEAIAADLNTKSQMRQTIVEANLQGGLFDLPYGQLRGAVGASYRELDYQFINDNLTSQGRTFNDQALGIYPSGNTAGYIEVKEFYGELLIPVLADLPGVREFNLEVGGRISDYNTTGTSYTFKILGDWQITDWLRIRGGFNRAERAPNIGELFLSQQQTFGVDTVGDLCSQLLQHPASANPNTNPTGAADVMAVCQALMTRDNNGVALPTTDFNSFYGPIWGAFQPTGAGFSFGSIMGNAKYRELVNPNTDPLKPEVADTWTLGAVIRSPLAAGPLSRLNFTVDYFNIKVEDPIGVLSVGAAQQLCLDPIYNPAIVGAAASTAAANAAIQTAACQVVRRNNSTTIVPGALNSGAMTTTYRNDGLVQLSGIDAQLSWNYPVGPGTVFANLNGNYMFEFKAKELEPNRLINYVGTQGTGVKGLNYGSSFRYRIFGTLGYSYRGASITLQWNHMPATEDSGEANRPEGVALGDFTDDNGIPAYDLFNLSASYQVNRAVNIRFSVDNLFNRWPPISGVDVDVDPTTGQLPGGGFSFFHDTQGRRFSLGASVKF